MNSGSGWLRHDKTDAYRTFTMWRGLFENLWARNGQTSGTHYKLDEWSLEVRDLYPAGRQTACGSDDK